MIYNNDFLLVATVDNNNVNNLDSTSENPINQQQPRNSSIITDQKRSHGKNIIDESFIL